MYVSCLVFLIAITIVSIVSIIIIKGWNSFNLYTFIIADGITIILISAFFIRFFYSKYLKFFEKAKGKNVKYK